jgi:integrase
MRADRGKRFGSGLQARPGEEARSIRRRSTTGPSAPGLPPTNAKLRLRSARDASPNYSSRSHPKAIQEFMGHATIEETFSRYGHLMPGTRNQARKLVDAYMDVATATERVPRHRHERR